MDALRTWFDVNRPLVLFVYGQVFFVLGLAIALRSRRRSRLELARSLPWLAAFGFAHGLYEWGDMFIPLQAQFLAADVILALRAGQLVLLGLSFACLFEFGLDLMRPAQAIWRWLRWLPAGLGLIWLAVLLGLAMQHWVDEAAWQVPAKVLARYSLALPGGVLAALGLRHQARTHVAALGAPRLMWTLRLAGAGLIAYAVFAGLIVTPAPFFPADTLNTHWLADALVAPAAVWRSGCGLIIMVAIIQALEIFEVETDRLIEHMEQAQVIAVERERIGRDLHDGAVQRVYAAGLQAQTMRARVDGPLGDGLDRLMLTLNDVLADLRAFVGDLQPAQSGADLVAALAGAVEEAGRASGIRVALSASQAPTLTTDRLAHLVSLTREALSNAVRHAHARAIQVDLTIEAGRLQLTIRDDGRGLPAEVEAGYGLRNMRDRARLLSGHLILASAPSQGTTVTLDIPLEVQP